LWWRVFPGFPWKAAATGTSRRRCLPGRVQSRASRSVLHPTRLVTRTNESNMCASHSVLTRPEGRNESKRYDPGILPARGDLGAVSTRLLPLSWMWRSLSVYVGTRKMVNHAWARRSQRKLWGRAGRGLKRSHSAASQDEKWRGRARVYSKALVEANKNIMSKAG